jgi:erythromycin esterase-like protein
MKSLRLVLASLFLAFCPAFASEIPFDKAEEFPASAYDLIAEKRVVWFGEMHGTREAPQLFLGLVRLVSSQHPAPPVVALEIPTTEQRAIDRYLAGGDESVLRASAFFKSELKDGRSSVAMVRLLSQLRTEKKAAVCCFDSAEATTPQERDAAMTKYLRACAKKFPTSKLVVLSGGVHARMVVGTSWNPAYRPAAFELNQQLGSVVSFTLVYEGGTIWAHTENGFGEHKVKGDRWSGNAPNYIKLYPKPTRGHDGAIFTRTLTGSPPW